MLNFIITEPLRKYTQLPCYYPKDYIIKYEDEPCDAIGLIKKGSIKMVHYDKDGNEWVMSEVNQGEFFGDFLIFSADNRYPGYLISKEETIIIYILKDNLNRLLSDSKDFRSVFIQNISEKALKLNGQNKLLMQNNLREKIIFWIKNEMKIQNKSKIALPSREKLATVLNVQRPSLSRELSKMKAHNLIDFDRNSIWLIKK
ncbi:MAG: Crp/Fnr family transcriptional regulator [Candidatus Izemoplasmataceae bacterium]